MYIMIIFGIIGYLMRKYKYDAPPLVLAFVLSPMLEQSLRRSLLLSNGSPLIFLQRPISAGLIILVVVLLVFPLIPKLRKKRGTVALESEE